MRSVTATVALLAGTNEPIWASRQAIPTDLMNVDLPAIFGPVKNAESKSLKEMVEGTGKGTRRPLSISQRFLRSIPNNFKGAIFR